MGKEKEKKAPPPKFFDWDTEGIFEMFERKEMKDFKRFGELDGICSSLKTDAKLGASNDSVSNRVAQFGKNELDHREPVTFWEMFVDACGDQVIQILAIASVISILFGTLLPNPHSGHIEAETGWIEGAAILISVTVVVMIGSIQNYEKAKKFEEMEQETSTKKVSATRGGEQITLMSNELVMGDLLDLEPGMEILADGIYVRGDGLKCNESPITGEPDLIEKDNTQPFIISGTSVEEGTGQMIVVAIGMNSFQGRMKNMKDDKKKKKKEGEGDEASPTSAASPSAASGASKNSNSAAAAAAGSENPEVSNNSNKNEEVAISPPAFEGETEKPPAETTSSSSAVPPSNVNPLQGSSSSSSPFETSKMEQDESKSPFEGKKPDDEKKGGDEEEEEEDEEEEHQTPLQKHLDELAQKIGQYGLLGAFALMAALMIKEGILIGTDKKEANASSFLSFVIVAVTLVAVAIPEGLPLAVTIALAFAMKAMMEDHCMVRVLASCETMGAATAVCSDKTGTLTTNQMTVVQGLFAENEFIIDGYELEPRDDSVLLCQRDDKFKLPELSPKVAAEFSRALSLNSTAKQVNNAETNELEWSGNKTEIGLLGMCKLLGQDYAKFREAIPEGQSHKYNFNSMKKRMTTLVRSGESGQVMSYVKGASEIIVESCSKYVTKSGEVSTLDDHVRAYINSVINDMAGQGNRTIALGYCELDLATFPKEEPEPKDLVFMGVLGIQDPLRPEVPKAVADCASAGVVVRMVTGDNIVTAKAIGKKCGIFHDENDIAMEGPEFRKMYDKDEKALIKILPNLRILARSSPKDKFILVKLLKDPEGCAEVVAVTGDGTNDAPALKLSDVGFAMKSGTDIAKSSADMVLLDDNFASVVNAIKWGRSVNDNIKKFLQYQLAINFAGCLLTIVGSLASETSKEPIAPVQLLWLNLIMDTLAALSLATERPEEASLTRQPVFKAAPLITNKMWAFIALHGTYQVIVILLILFLGHDWFQTVENDDFCHPGLNQTKNETTNEFTDPVMRWCYFQCKHVGGIMQFDTFRCQQGATHSTIIFNTFIWFQVFNVINARKIYGECNAFEGLWDRSRNLMMISCVIILLQTLAVEFFGGFMKTSPLRWSYWLICVGFGMVELILGVVIRLLPIENYVPTADQEKSAREKERFKKIDEDKQAKLLKKKAEPGSRPGSTLLPRLGTGIDPALKRNQSLYKKNRRGTLSGSLSPRANVMFDDVPVVEASASPQTSSSSAS